MEVQVLPHHAGEGRCPPQWFQQHIQSCTDQTLPSLPLLLLLILLLLAVGSDKVPQVCELGPSPGGQAGSGAAG